MQVLLATVRQRSALRGDWSLHEKPRRSAVSSILRQV